MIAYMMNGIRSRDPSAVHIIDSDDEHVGSALGIDDCGDVREIERFDLWRKASCVVVWDTNGFRVVKNLLNLHPCFLVLMMLKAHQAAREATS